MKQLAHWVLAVAESIGGPGLFLIAFLDSSFLSFPQANDLLIVLKVAQHKELAIYFAALATLGSLAGCLALYAVARRGGEAVLRRRGRPERVQRIRDAFARYGLLAIIVPALLPPPAPFKLFVLTAGVVSFPLRLFVLGLLLGRGTRYFGIAFLTVRYGEAAMGFLDRYGRGVAFGLAGLVVVGAVAHFVLKRRRRTGPPPRV
jgi:membrane protein YqaA with SNARE-associated domain